MVPPPQKKTSANLHPSESACSSLARDMESQRLIEKAMERRNDIAEDIATVLHLTFVLHWPPKKTRN